jgi:hypothetical protein
VAGVAPWNWQMVKANYNVFALSQFNSGQIIKWVDPGSGQYVTFQPMALQWTNSINQIQQISMPQSVAAQASDDVLYWPAAYGSGRNFRYQATPLRLNKQLIIDSPSALPSTSYDTLELNFIISVSSGVNIIVDEAAWDKKTQKDTTKAIAFRLPGGAILWSFAAPRAWDSVGNETAGSMRLKRSGRSLYVSVRFPKSWIDTAVFPIILDPAVDYQVGAGANDGIVIASNIYPTHNYLYFGFLMTNPRHFYCRWPNVIIPDGATVTKSYVSFCYHTSDGTPPECVVYFENAANPAAPSSASDFKDRTKTTAKINIAGPVLTDGDWWDTGSLNSILNELLGEHSYASPGAAMQLLEISSGSGTNYSSQFSYDGDSAKAPKLHIEYTEAASGNPFYAYAQQ